MAWIPAGAQQTCRVRRCNFPHNLNRKAQHSGAQSA
jgi:hypothetical protein